MIQDVLETFCDFVFNVYVLFPPTCMSGIHMNKNDDSAPLHCLAADMTESLRQHRRPLQLDEMSEPAIDDVCEPAIIIIQTSVRT